MSLIAKETKDKCRSPIISIQIHDGKQHSPKRRKLETHDQDKPQRAASSILEVQAKQAHLLQRPDHTEYIEAASLTPAATDKSITNGLRNSIDTAALDTHEEVRDPALPQGICCSCVQSSIMHLLPYALPKTEVFFNMPKTPLQILQDMTDPS